MHDSKAAADKIINYSKEKKHKDELLKYVATLNTDTLIELVSSRLLTSTGQDLLDGIFVTIPNTIQGQERKYRILDCCYRTLAAEDVVPGLVSSYCAACQLVLPHLSQQGLAKLAGFAIDSISKQQNSENFIWRDLLPECLRLILQRGTSFSHYDTEMSPVEFNSQCIRTLLQNSWNPVLLTPLAAMLREMQMTKEEHLQVVNKLCCDLEKLLPDSIPPLLHQLLRPAGFQHPDIVCFRVSEYFTSRLLRSSGRHLAHQLHESESPVVDLNEIEHDACDIETGKRAEATCIYMMSDNGSALKQLAAALKTAARRPATFLGSPTLMKALLAVPNPNNLQLIKTAFSYNYTEAQRRQDFTWCRDALPPPVDAKAVIKNLVESSNAHCHMISEGLLSLAGLLLDSMTFNFLSGQLRHLGCGLLLRLARTTEGGARAALGLLKDRLLMGTPYARRQLAETLESLCSTCPGVLGCIPLLKSILESALTCSPEAPPGNFGIQGSRPGLPALALRPAIRRDNTLRDCLIMLCRKGLFSRDLYISCASVQGLLSLLGSLKAGSGALSQAALPPSEYSALTQISISVHGPAPTAASGRVNSRAVCLEGVQLLRKCLQQDASIREHLYQGLPRALTGRPELYEPILELLQEHLTKFYVAGGDDVLPPLLLDKCVIAKDDTAVIVEPIGHLLFCIQKLLQCCEPSDGGDDIVGQGIVTRLTTTLEELTKRLALCTQDHLKTDDGVGEQLRLQLVVASLEALQAFAVRSPEHNSGPNALVTLQKTYTQMQEQIKQLSTKTKKAREKTSQKAPAVKKMGKKDKAGAGDHKTGKKDGVAGSGTVWDLQTVDRILKILHCEGQSSNHWSIVRNKRDLHRCTVRAATFATKGVAESGRGREELETTLRLATLLYKRCLSRLNDFCDFDSETALLSVECFQELLDLHVVYSPSKMSNFFNTVIDSDNDEQSPDALSAAVSSFCECLSTQIDLCCEGLSEKDEPAAKRLPQALLTLLTDSFKHITENSAVEKWRSWLMQLLSTSRVPGAQTSVPALLALGARSSLPWGPIEALLEALTTLLGNNDAENETQSTLQHEIPDGSPFACLKVSTCVGALSALCGDVAHRQAAAEAMVGRLRAEASPGAHCSTTAARAVLKSRERALCTELTNLSMLCQRLACLCCPAGSCFSLCAKALTRQHALLASTALHMSTRGPANVTSARFDKVVRVSGRPLSRAVDKFVSHGEATPGNAAVLKLVPRLAYEMEQFCQKVTRLASKTKLDLVPYLSKGNARDFRIKASAVREALKARQGQTDVTEDDEEMLDGTKNEEEVQEAEPEIEEVIDDGEINDMIEEAKEVQTDSEEVDTSPALSEAEQSIEEEEVTEQPPKKKCRSNK